MATAVLGTVVLSAQLVVCPLRFRVPVHPLLASRDQRPKPLRDRFLRITQSPVGKDGCLAVRRVEIAVVVHQHIGQSLNCCLRFLTTLYARDLLNARSPDKPAHGASAVFIDADQQARRTRDGFEVRERSRFEERSHPLPPRVGIHLREAFGQGPHRARPPQGHSAGAFEQRLHGAAQLGPELDLSRNRPFRSFGRKSGVKDKFVGKFNRLAHTSMAAFCYRNGKSIHRRAAIPQIAICNAKVASFYAISICGSTHDRHGSGERVLTSWIDQPPAVELVVCVEINFLSVNYSIFA